MQGRGQAILADAFELCILHSTQALVKQRSGVSWDLWRPQAPPWKQQSWQSLQIEL